MRRYGTCSHNRRAPIVAPKEDSPMLRAISCLGIVFLAAACGGGSPSPGPASHSSGKGGNSPSPSTSMGGTTPAPAGWNAVVGGGGLFAQSFDDVLWNDLPAGTAENLYSVTCTSETSGWVAGANGFIGHTVDGGKSWTAQATNTAADLYGVRFGS